MKHLILIFFVLISNVLPAQNDRQIDFPDIPGFKTLVCDLHIHTVFSDGSVWPDIRVREALFDGVDAIAITDHLEYQPHEDDIPNPDRNRSFDLAKKTAENSDLIVIRGVEITRSMPPGHSNALFVRDANAFLKDDVLEVFREAKAQEAFVFWNHPMWAPQQEDGMATLSDLHGKLISEGLLHGIEVVNEDMYSDEALSIALENDLTILATSDIHGLIDWTFDIPGGGHRPVTLVFAEMRSEEGIKQALEEGRTVAWFRNRLIGREEYLKPLLESSLEVESFRYSDEHVLAEVVIINHSDADLIARNLTGFTLHEDTDIVEFKGNSRTVLNVKTLERLDNFTLSFEILNATQAPREHPIIELRVE